MKEPVLFVDDEPAVLAGYERQMRTAFDVHTAQGAPKGLELLRGNTSFAVVVADMRMPEMDGVQFLRAVKERSPLSVRMMLTGHADTTTAIDAVNEGSIFRFLTKPCPPEVLKRAIFAGIEQWRLVRAEKELLEKTLKGSVRVLIDLLELLNPAAFGRANRARHVVRHIGHELNLPNLWQFELAALLSQIGFVTVPPSILELYCSGQPLAPHEKEMLDAHPRIGAELLINIPRMEPIAEMIRNQDTPYAGFGAEEHDPEKLAIAQGAQLLRLALDFDSHVSAGSKPSAALAAMRRQPRSYNPEFLSRLEHYKIRSDRPQSVRLITVRELTVDIEADEDIKTTNGLLLVAKGRRVTYPLLLRIRNFASGVGVREPFRVRDT
ncbi:MAG: response regulator [Candidatus Hydrogenedentes bacterium]|nr:response regulator [Candidatus Hydrogenedentota bacterium]